jgi:ClpX C4-type zinc finger
MAQESTTYLEMVRYLCLVREMPMNNRLRDLAERAGYPDPTVFICSECVELCLDIVEKFRNAKSSIGQTNHQS